MYLHLSPHTRLVFFNHSLILLDLLKNKYTILNEEIADKIIKILSNETSMLSLDSLVFDLKSEKILSNQLFDVPQELPTKRFLTGMPDLDWRVNRQSLHETVPNELKIEAILTLCKVYFMTQTKRLYKLICSLQKLRDRKKRYCAWDSFVNFGSTSHRKIDSKEEDHSRVGKAGEENRFCKGASYQNSQNLMERGISATVQDIELLANALNQACFHYPWRVKCLEWSVTLSLMALKRNLKCNLVIGVQNYPFASHAWVEVQGKVVFDSPELPDKMSVILREPFA